jgi:hypothetical protein
MALVVLLPTTKLSSSLTGCEEATAAGVDLRGWIPSGNVFRLIRTPEPTGEAEKRYLGLFLSALPLPLSVAAAAE